MNRELFIKRLEVEQLEKKADFSKKHLTNMDYIDQLYKDHT